MRLLAVRCLHMEDAFLRIVNRVRVEPLGRLFAHGIGHAETAANGYLPDTPAQGCVHICCTKTEHTGAHVGAEPRSNAHAAALRGSAVLPNRCWGLWPRLQPTARWAHAGETEGIDIVVEFVGDVLSRDCPGICGTGVVLASLDRGCCSRPSEVSAGFAESEPAGRGTHGDEPAVHQGFTCSTTSL